MKKSFYALLLIVVANILSNDNHGPIPEQIPGLKLSSEIQSASKEKNQNITWPRAILYLIAAVDAGTELHNVAYEDADATSKINIAKATLLGSLVNGRDVYWWDVVAYGGIVTAQAVINYVKEKGTIIAAHKKIIEAHERNKKQTELAEPVNNQETEKEQAQKVD